MVDALNALDDLLLKEGLAVLCVLVHETGAEGARIHAFAPNETAWDFTEQVLRLCADHHMVGFMPFTPRQ